MFNLADLAYVLNGTPIALLNNKNGQYLSLDLRNYTFSVDGTHPYLTNKDFENETKITSKLILVLSSMPNYELNSPRSIITYGAKVCFMTPNHLFVVATDKGELRLEPLKGDKALNSANLPMNSNFIVINPYNQSNYSQTILYNDDVIFRSTFGGYLSLGEQFSYYRNESNGGINIPPCCGGTTISDESIWKLIKTNVPFIPDWVNKRKYLNYNLNSYLYNLDKGTNDKGVTATMTSGGAKKKNTITSYNNNTTTGYSTKKQTLKDNKPSLMTLSSSMQDKCLVEDLLLSMLGMEGNYIKRLTSYTTPKDFKVEFQIEPYLENPTCDAPLLSLGNLLLPISYFFNSITNYLNISSNVETGLINKSFCFGIKKILREYVLFINQLDCQMREGTNPLNLQQMWWLCQPSLKLLDNLNKLTEKCSMIKGGALINIVYSAYLHETDSQMKNMYKFLLDKSFTPYFDMLKLWVCRGYLDNEHEFQEFMIISPKDFNKEKLNEYYFDLFWEMKFKLNRIHIPEFLNHSADKILFIGKSLNIIRECGKIIQCPFENEFESFDSYNNNEQNEKIFEKERLIVFEQLIDKIYVWTNMTLKSILFKEKNLISLLCSFKKFFLMGAGDFYTYLLDLGEEMFPQEKPQIKFESLQTQITNALRATSANNDINKDQFYFTLSNMIITMEKQYLEKYMDILLSNTDTNIKQITSSLQEVIDDTSTIASSSDMKVFEALVLECKIDWPLNLIFSKKNIIKYKLLFRHLIRLKYVERSLCETWIIQQNFREVGLQQLLRMCHFLRNMMLTFIQNLIYYFFNEIIEPQFMKLMKNLYNSSSMEEVMKYHDEFLDVCMKDCLLGNDEVLADMYSVIQCCSVYSLLIRRYYKNALRKEKDIHQQNIGRKKERDVFERKKRQIQEQEMAVKSILLDPTLKYDSFNQQFKMRFLERFKKFVRKIEKMNQTENTFNTNLKNFLTKLDSTNYYYDQFSNEP